MESLPQIINVNTNVKDAFPYLDEGEISSINEAKQLISVQLYSYALVAIWNAAVSNLRRKVEAYGVDLWLSTIKDEPGRKKYNPDGDTLVERWDSVDDFVLLLGAKRLGIIDDKAAKSLEMINWMRNHASSAHNSDCQVTLADVAGLVILIQTNLFGKRLPDPGHSITSLFKPVKTKALDSEDISALKDQIRSFSYPDIRTSFGFLLDLIEKGEEPAYSNSKELFPVAWDLANEDLKKQLGEQFHSIFLDPDSDNSADKKARSRLLELIVKLDAVKYIPEGTRARLFRHAAKRVAEAKNTMYGWAQEEAACKTLLQLGTCVPSVAFEDVYQEILSVWCGNYWGHSNVHDILRPFIDCLDSSDVLKMASLFAKNRRVQAELHQRRPNTEACSLLGELKEKVTFEINKGKIDEIKNSVLNMIS